MKSLLIALLVLTFSLPSWAKWDPSVQQFIDLAGDLQIEKDREKLYRVFKQAIDTGMNADYVINNGISFLTAFAIVDFHRWEGDQDQRPIPFTDWDKKLLKLSATKPATLSKRLGCLRRSRSDKLRRDL